MARGAELYFENQPSQPVWTVDQQHERAYGGQAVGCGGTSQNDVKPSD